MLNSPIELIDQKQPKQGRTNFYLFFLLRYAVEGASQALHSELAHLGIKVITINPIGILPELLFSHPKLLE